MTKVQPQCSPVAPGKMQDNQSMTNMLYEPYQYGMIALSSKDPAQDLHVCMAAADSAVFLLELNVQWD